jgi:hypothetical protein
MVDKVSTEIEIELDIQGDFDKVAKFTVSGDGYDDLIKNTKRLAETIKKENGGNVRVKKFPFKNLINNPLF